MRNVRARSACSISAASAPSAGTSELTTMMRRSFESVMGDLSDMRFPLQYRFAKSLPPLIFLPSMIVLGVESSCDETGLALYDTGRGLLSHALHSQVAMHEQYGGVGTELAFRD